MKKCKLIKIIAIVLIRIFFLNTLGGGELCTFAAFSGRDTLSAPINIQRLLLEKYFIASSNGMDPQRPEFSQNEAIAIIRKCTELLTADKLVELRNRVEDDIRMLGYGRAKFYEVTRYEEESGKWYIRERIKAGGADAASARYIEHEGTAKEEKGFVLSKAKAEGIDFFHIENRWAHCIGEANASLQIVAPELINIDVDELGDGYKERVKEILYVIVRDLQGNIMGILSIDNWQKPSREDPGFAEPLFSGGEDQKNKIKLLRAFAQMTGLALKRLEFEQEKENIDEFKQKEEGRRNTLHDMKNILMRMIYYVKQIKLGLREKITNFGDTFKYLAAKANRETDSVVLNFTDNDPKSLDYIYKVIDKVILNIRAGNSQEIENMFSDWKFENKKTGRGQKTLEIHRFLETFEWLAVSQSYIFDRKETTTSLHKKIQEIWREIEQEIDTLRQDCQGIEDANRTRLPDENPENYAQTDMFREKVLAPYEEARGFYNRYIKLLESADEVDFLIDTINLEVLSIGDIVLAISAIEDENIQLKIKAKDTIDDIIADRNILRLVFEELIENAVKYEGRYCELNIFKDMENEGYVRIDFITDGLGIAPLKRERESI